VIPPNKQKIMDKTIKIIVLAYLFITDNLVKSLEGKQIKLHQLPKEIKATLQNFLGLQFITCDVINKVLQEKKNSGYVMQ